MEFTFSNKKHSAQDNIKHLEELLAKWLPMDYENLKKNYPFEMEIKMVHKGKYTPDQLLALKTKGLDDMQAIMKKELAYWKSKL